MRIADPGDLISAVPALLGFHPRRSLVAICLTGTSVGAVMRHDLVLEDPGLMELVIERFAAVCARDGANRVLVVMLDDRIGPGAAAVDLPRHRDLVARFRMRLGAAGIELAGAHIAPAVAAGLEWFALERGDRGVLPDPAASEVAAAHVFGGRAIRGSREELEAVLEPCAEHERALVAELIDEARETGARGRLRVAAVDPVGSDRAALEGVLCRIAQVESGDELSAHEYAELALALENPTVRDALLALSVGSHADAADQMWILLGRSLPEPECAEALALLGFSAYLRGDGPMAGVALCAALAADPCHGLANLLDDALQTGVRPTALRDLADVGFGVAAALGVSLPNPEPLPPGGV
ncbi:DUF4192 domain-containing protein [Rhodococcus sp. ABRD24]|uniref:DUF4192 domain-containing protein n=1 Tax=Rhodococcus sp. ABRD24 TaxID=2507582 RepID=UPI001F6128F1|nr:DUF4192 domain-containing protein [Rhodococcus sp. ABRD24]